MILRSFRNTSKYGLATRKNFRPAAKYHDEKIFHWCFGPICLLKIIQSEQ